MAVVFDHSGGRTCPARCPRSSIGNTQLFSQYHSDTFSFVSFTLVCVCIVQSEIMNHEYSSGVSGP